MILGKPVSAIEPPRYLVQAEIIWLRGFETASTHAKSENCVTIEYDSIHIANMTLINNQLDLQLYVFQHSPSVFNKAAMMNLGFVEARMLGDFDCFFFHDVDMLPENDRNYYICTDQPRHVGAYVDKFQYE